jgi:hypothetical protein
VLEKKVGYTWAEQAAWQVSTSCGLAGGRLTGGWASRPEKSNQGRDGHLYPCT